MLDENAVAMNYSVVLGLKTFHSLMHSNLIKSYLHEDAVFKDFSASTVPLQNPKLKAKLGDTMGSITSKPSKPKAAASNASLSAYISVESSVAKNSLQISAHLSNYGVESNKQ
jgi:hypothetical protein